MCIDKNIYLMGGHDGSSARAPKCTPHRRGSRDLFRICAWRGMNARRGASRRTLMWWADHGGWMRRRLLPKERGENATRCSTHPQGSSGLCRYLSVARYGRGGVHRSERAQGGRNRLHYHEQSWRGTPACSATETSMERYVPISNEWRMLPTQCRA